jgi:hypothetical protein
MQKSIPTNFNLFSIGHCLKRMYRWIFENKELMTIVLAPIKWFIFLKRNAVGKIPTWILFLK